jgi:hypothetical protein
MQARIATRCPGKDASHGGSELVLTFELRPDLVRGDRIVMFEVELAEPVLQPEAKVNQPSPHHELEPRAQEER